MQRKYTREPLPISVLERMHQERAGIPVGTRCAHQMMVRKNARPADTFYYPSGKTVTRPRGVKPGGPCPRYATRQIGDQFYCDVHQS